jgi:hypothetical protein
MKGMGNLESTIPDPEHVNGSIHFIGTLDVNARPEPIEWTASSSAVLKSAVCPSSAPPAATAPSK